MSWRPHLALDDTIACLEHARLNDCLFNWLVYPRRGGSLLGTIGCKLDKHIVQFGYYFAQDAWGHGYTTEAARRMVEIWLREPTIWRVQAFCDPKNTASVRVLEKAGLTYGLTRTRCGNMPWRPILAVCPVTSGYTL
jgi:[ribosomal protein S5]-alanine N-acetyltransferase